MIYNRIPSVNSFMILESIDSSMRKVLEDILKDKKFFFDIEGSGIKELGTNYFMVIKNFDYNKKEFDMETTDEDAAKKLGAEIKKRFLFEPSDLSFDSRDVLFPINVQ